MQMEPEKKDILSLLNECVRDINNQINVVLPDEELTRIGTAVLYVRSRASSSDNQTKAQVLLEELNYTSDSSYWDAIGGHCVQLKQSSDRRAVGRELLSRLALTLPYTTVKEAV